ncbi:Lcp9 [Drosophila busckii]|uniref:Lcp9 n=1 Tax=Drosophila busckii TaxID=30019 RepID=A0A0M4EW11_DROBS|nr:larval cuticle protein 9 [Drosophila busckii]ALC41907.1 Lcp9 [Drosophila busckii]
MKFLFVLACLLAVAFASDDRSSVATEQAQEVNPDSFSYKLITSNGINVNQQGHLVDEHTQDVAGSYEYTSPEGKVIKVTYTAGVNGYKPTLHY